MSTVQDVSADARLEAQRAMARRIQTGETQSIGMEQEETLGMDEIARLTQTRYGFTPFRRIYVGDRCTGAILSKDEAGNTRRFKDIDGKVKDLYVTREWIEPCALNIFNNVTRRVSKDKAVTGVDMPGASVLEKNGPLAHHVGSREYGADIQGYRRANATLKSEVKYAEWIVLELSDTYTEEGFIDLAPLISLEADLADAVFKTVLPSVSWVTDPRLPGERIPHLPDVLRYLNEQTPQNIEKHLKKRKATAEELAHALTLSCRAGQAHAAKMLVERGIMINDAKNSRPGVSDYGLPHYRAFLATGKLIPTEAYGAPDAVVPESDPDLKEAVKTLAKVSEQMLDSDSTRKKMERQEKQLAEQGKEIAELRAGIQELRAASRASATVAQDNGANPQTA